MTYENPFSKFVILNEVKELHKAKLPDLLQKARHSVAMEVVHIRHFVQDDKPRSWVTTWVNYWH